MKKGSFLVFLGIILMIIGGLRGEILTVLTKAGAICLECIGIG